MKDFFWALFTLGFAATLFLGAPALRAQEKLEEEIVKPSQEQLQEFQKFLAKEKSELNGILGAASSHFDSAQKYQQLCAKEEFSTALNDLIVGKEKLQNMLRRNDEAEKQFHPALDLQVIDLRQEIRKGRDKVNGMIQELKGDFAKKCQEGKSPRKVGQPAEGSLKIPQWFSGKSQLKLEDPTKPKQEEWFSGKSQLNLEEPCPISIGKMKKAQGLGQQAVQSCNKKSLEQSLGQLQALMNSALKNQQTIGRKIPTLQTSPGAYQAALNDLAVCRQVYNQSTQSYQSQKLKFLDKCGGL